MASMVIRPVRIAPALDEQEQLRYAVQLAMGELTAHCVFRQAWERTASQHDMGRRTAVVRLLRTI